MVDLGCPGEFANDGSSGKGGSTMKVVAYARVSTVEQNAAMQIEELRVFAIKRGWELSEEYVDSGVSGSKESRPALNRLLADAKRRKFSAVLVYRYDRFARSLRQLVNALCEFDALGIHFISLHEGVDTSTPNGRLVFGIFASIAEFERELIRGRVRSGLAAARARGKRIGRPPRTLLSAETRTAIASCYAKEKTSLRALAKRFGTSLATVQRCIGVCQRAAGEGPRSA
jgi:DNA invertase Pin-like site-specific DNA recombinase